MDLLIYFLKHTWDFGIASIPLINVFFLKKVCKVKDENIIGILILELLSSVYFWTSIKDIHIFLYQLVSYISALVWVLSSLYIKKK